MQFLFPCGLKDRQFELSVETPLTPDIELSFDQFYGVSQPLHEMKATHLVIQSSWHIKLTITVSSSMWRYIFKASFILKEDLTNPVVQT